MTASADAKQPLSWLKAYPDILIIPGVEISTTDGDILVLGQRSYLRSLGRLKQLLIMQKA